MFFYSNHFAIQKKYVILQIYEGGFMENKKPSRIYQVLSTASIVGLFFTIGLLVTGIMQGFLTATTSLVLAIFTIVFAGCIMSLVWINNIENKKYFKTSIVFLAFTILCCILWIIAAIAIYIMYTKAKVEETYTPIGLLNFVKIAFIISIQFVVSNIIARNIIKYKKSYIAFQIIMYISALFVDFYASMFSIAISFTASDGVFLNKSITSFLFSGGMVTVFLLFVVYIAIANSVLNTIQTKRNGGSTNRTRRGRRSLIGRLMDNVEYGEFDEAVSPKVDEPAVVEEKKEQNSAQDRLTKLKELYDAKLITEEEYNSKRAEILEEM